ncbi:hypothetical protein [Streptomyces antimicrobicus]|uniref:Uncharacterized protein n=1 Tax=Streptomyces antimicrobicus TaxID=2883108 RepID=A0ABS8B5R8_9ACTN|nr:hypothetical protein [Streptomyces antimicrobicus]MCB5179943.1 hypothetical protein [Streptomyces antimicrobicus]
MSAQPRPTLPPVRLHPDAELARAALAAPLLSRAVRLARWAGPGTRVGAGGELADEQLPEAAAVLGLADDEDGAAYASEAWRVALDTGLVDVTDPVDVSGPGEDAGTGEGAGTDASVGTGEGVGAGEGAAADAGAEFGTAGPGADLALVTAGAPTDVLDLWLAALDTVLADASVPDLDDLVDALDAGGEIDFERLDWDPQREADLLDAVLANLYLLTVTEGGAGDAPVPLPVLAASLVVPEDMAEPTDEVLERVSEAMMRLDAQFRQLEGIGLVEFRPVDEDLMAEADDEDFVAAADPDEEDVARYGMVRLTPLGLYGVRARLLEAGVEAPAVGDLADKGADVLLDTVSAYPEDAAQAEIELWLARAARDASEGTGSGTAAAVAELLAAARGGDAGGPLRRLRCQQALAVAGPAAEPVVRAVLDDPELGGLARVWLAEQGATDVPPPSEALVFWLTVDTIAAQLAADDGSAELPALMESLTAHHTAFFDTAWRVEHPATADVLEAMGRLHPDRKAAKEARKAAFKARSHRP